MHMMPIAQYAINIDRECRDAIVNEARRSEAEAWTLEAETLEVEAWTLEAEATISGLEA